MTLKEFVEKRLNALGVSWSYLSYFRALTGHVSKSTLKRIENGYYDTPGNRMGPITQFWLARALGCTVDDIERICPAKKEEQDA